MERQSEVREYKYTPVATVLIGISILFGLYLTSLYSYLLFHSIAEMFSIAVACGIFMIAWNSRRFMNNSYFLFIGIAYLFIGGLDGIHTLAYTGMGVFPGYNTNLPTQLWIAARYLESLSLLIAPFLIGRRLKAIFTFLGYAVLFSLLLVSILYWDIFPTCFVEGVEGIGRLTLFKKISEYIISLILVGCIMLTLRKRREFDMGVLRLMVASIVVTVFSEMSFTFYVHAYGFSNLIGHFLKIVSFYLIYRALIKTGLVQPYNLLFRDLKQNEEALRKERERIQRQNEFLNSVLESLSNPFYVVDASDYTIKIANPAAHLGNISGSSTCYALTHNSDKPCGNEEHPCPVEEIKRTRKPLIVEHVHYNEAGEMRNVEVHGYPIFDHEGNVVQIIEYCLDITERKQAEEMLRDAEQRFRSVVQTASDAIIVVDSRGEIVFWNRGAEAIFGYSVDEAIGEDVTIIMPERYREDYLEQMSYLISIEQPKIIGKTIEFAGLRKDGSEFPLELSLATWDSKGETFFAAIIRDITGRKEEEARKASEQEQERRRVLSMRSDRLRSLGEMAAGIAHELNQPLQGVRGMAERLLISIDRGWELTEEKIRDRADTIIEQADRMVHIIEHIRIFARESGKPERRPVKVNDVVRAGMDLLGTQFRSRGIQLERELMESLPVISANPFSLEEVVINLLINARDAVEEQMKAGSVSTPPRVLLRTLLDQTDESGYVKIEVTDSGVGIPEEIIERVFDPFFTTKGPDRGTGLGLSISRSIVEGFGGAIYINSMPGSGTTVTISLPVEEALPHEEQ
jgi:PAS domain S-box-containing protein